MQEKRGKKKRDQTIKQRRRYYEPVPKEGRPRSPKKKGKKLREFPPKM